MAPVMVTGVKNDDSAWPRNMAIVNELQTAELKKLAAVADARREEILERREQNVKLLTGMMPSIILKTAIKA
jgi:hypothetical protein